MKLPKRSCQSYSKKYYKLNKSQIDKRLEKYHEKRRLEWDKVLPKVSNCEVCGKNLYLRHKDRKKTIHFDHRHGGTEAIKVAPSTWIKNNGLSKKTKKVFDSCDFGILCGWCNKHIPTKDRLVWLNKLTNYIVPKGTKNERNGTVAKPSKTASKRK